MRLTFLLIFLLTNFSSLFSQDQIWDIFTFDKQPYSKVVPGTLHNDTLCVKSMGNRYKVALESIKTMTRQRKSVAGISTLAGMGIGDTLMNFYGQKRPKKKYVSNRFKRFEYWNQYRFRCDRRRDIWSAIVWEGTNSMIFSNCHPKRKRKYWNIFRQEKRQSPKLFNTSSTCMCLSSKEHVSADICKPFSLKPLTGSQYSEPS
ncbi:MAG: hypothetical protein D6677_13900, partial [Calditrichaeota bacterium]